MVAALFFKVIVMNKIVMCLVFISCTSLFSMDSAITMKFLDEDGNVQAQRQVSADVLKSKSNTLKEMFNDIPVSEVSIPASELPVKVWDEIESLWALRDSKKTLAADWRLGTKSLGEIVQILNSLEYLHEPNQYTVLFEIISVLARQIKCEPSKGHQPILQQLKPRLSRLVINSMFPRSKLYETWRRKQRFSSDFIKITYRPPQNITICQAAVLFKILNRQELETYETREGRFIDEVWIYNTIDKAAGSDIDYYFYLNGYTSTCEAECCTIL